MKNVNLMIYASVEVVLELDMNAVVAGITKACVDHITISGYDDGTDASLPN